MANIVQIRIYGDFSNPAPTLSLPDVPWYAGITVLQAMIIGEAMSPKNFKFRVEYRSIYGAQIDSIDDVSDGDKPNHYWMLWINGRISEIGASEAIILEDTAEQTALVEWKYQDLSSAPEAALKRKTQAF